MSQPPQPSTTASESVKCSVSDCWRALQKLRSDCPLVQCITNYVSMDIMANTLLAIGASPAMVHGEYNISTFSYSRVSRNEISLVLSPVLTASFGKFGILLNVIAGWKNHSERNIDSNCIFWNGSGFCKRSWHVRFVLILGKAKTQY